ncbi:Iron transporter FTH1 [Candida viswanathii]|uniref:Iron transporter FTH1 n=1 Tax=Candida viswanathii TaxID=5486 RepID=A0A367YBE1_9ASCO|nr:Iron transporter FTH1 [Candida viswanathii]
MAQLEEYFSVQVFFIILRETLETAIIISVLLSFINQRSHKQDQQHSSTVEPQTSSSATVTSESQTHLEQVNGKLKLQVWVGALLGLSICFVIGLTFTVLFYVVGQDYWAYTERVWEGVFCILSSVIITIMGIGLLRINKVMKIKWWIKLGDAYNNEEYEEDEELEGEEEIARLGDDETYEDSMANYGGTRSSSESNTVDEAIPLTVSSGTPSTKTPRRPQPKKKKKKQPFTKKYYLAILPLVTTLREGLEAVVFIGGSAMTSTPFSIVVSVVCGIALGSMIGYVLYQGGNKLSLQYFLICSTCFLYVVSAGLISRGVWFLELERYVRACGGMDVSETGSGPGSYDIATSVWHVNCCNGLTDGWWMVLNAIVGWTNSATYGSVASYMAYWVLVIVWLQVKLYEEREGVLPWIPVKWQLKRIRKKIRLYELRNAQQQEHARHEEELAGTVLPESQGLLQQN